MAALPQGAERSRARRARHDSGPRRRCCGASSSSRATRRVTREVQRAGSKLFLEQRPAGADNYKLFVEEGGRRRVLIDPTLRSGAHSHLSLDWWLASNDGARVVYGLSKDGSEDSILHILNVAEGRDLAEQIPNTEVATPHWLDDGTGFFYTQLTGKVDTPERYLDSQARFHRLGTDPASDHPRQARPGCARAV